MSAQPLSSIDQIDPEWLTGVLTEAGILSQGSVVSIQTGWQIQYAGPGFRADKRFRVRFSTPQPSTVPEFYYLKTSTNSTYKQAGVREIRFYTSLANRMTNPPAVRCFHSAYDPSSGDYHLLLEDISKTHRGYHPEIPAPKDDTRRMLDTLARFHAFWWNTPEVDLEVERILYPEIIEEDFQELRTAFAEYVHYLGDRLNPNRRANYELVLYHYPEVIGDRLAKRDKLTIVHNDAHAGNFLLPVDTKKSSGFIVDWQQWSRGIGPFDVAYLIALFWFPERRQRMERELVKYYHSILIDNGVSGYNWEQCWFDYRLGAIKNLLVPFWSWVDLGENWGWHRWYQIEKGMLAFEDLSCDELLQGSLTE